MSLNNLIWFEKYRPKTFKDMSLPELHKKAFEHYVEQKGFPHLLLEGSAGSGKCVDKDTLIITTTGIRKIAECAPSVNFNTEGFTEHEVFIASEMGVDVSSHFYLEKNCPTLKIDTHEGFSLCGTYEHPVLTFNPDTCDYRYVQLKDIEEGTFVCIPKKVNVFPDNNYKFKWAHTKLKMDSTSIDFIPPGHITSSLAAVLGYLVANGSGSGSMFSSCSAIIREDYIRHLSNLGVQSKDTDRAVVVMRKQFQRFINSLFPDGFTTARFKTVPDCIVQSTKDIQRIFLRTLFDCDSYQRGCGFEFCTASKDIANIIHLMLQNFGILSSKRPKYLAEYDHEYWRIHIYGAELDNLFTEILHDSIKYKLPEPLKRNTNKDVIPGLSLFVNSTINRLFDINRGGYFEVNGEKHINFTCSGVHIKTDATYSVLNKYIHNLVNLMPQVKGVVSLIERLKTIKDKNYFYSKVASKRASGVRDVFDFTIPKSHSFVSNGLISHNSSTAFILMQSIPSVKLVFNGSTVGIDVVRTTITDFAKSKASDGKLKIVLLDEADKIKIDALGSLHNVMETYSTNCRFILTCNHVDKIDKPIQSRCTKYTFTQFPKGKLTRLVTSILNQEKVLGTSDADISSLISRFYPDVRSIINNLQAACITGKFNSKAIGSLQIDPITVGTLIEQGKIQSLRQYIAGTTEFSFLYKWLFNVFLYENVKDELKAEVALAVASFCAVDQQVPDREMQFVACALTIMMAMSIEPSFGA